MKENGKRGEGEEKGRMKIRGRVEDEDKGKRRG